MYASGGTSERFTPAVLIGIGAAERIRRNPVFAGRTRVRAQWEAPEPGWRNGRRGGLKIPCLRTSGFDSRPRYQETVALILPHELVTQPS